jgi:catechol 2,3-dioxygenase-like lactoylglutathione lyase family enzyme
MLDHVGFAISDLDRSRWFYDAALAPLGLAIQMTVPPDEARDGHAAVGYGKDGKPIFWIGDKERVGEGTHVAFLADRRAQVDAFHAAAIRAGGIDIGGPGLRPHYAADYYAAFVLDPNGFNIEAVTYSAE